MISFRWLIPVLLSSLVIAGCSPSEPVQEISVDSSQAGEILPEPAFSHDDWPGWRGLGSDNIAVNADVPLTWSESENIVWQSPVPGRGHASPTVLGDCIYLATADEKAGTQSVVCFDRATGAQKWQTIVHDSGLPGSPGHQKSTHASSTVATDGERLFAAFLNSDAIWLTALDLEGNQLWQTEVGPFVSSFGYAASPAVYKSFVILAADHKGGGYLAAVHRKTGDIQWRKPRPAKQTYASPLVATVAGRDQVLLPGADLVASYDPNTGEEIWSQPGTTMSCAATMATNGELVYAAAGYSGTSVACYRGDGSGDLVWKNNKKLYVPSLLVHEGYVYAANDDGIAFCWNAETGENAWTGRLGGNFSASPVLAGRHIYVPNEKGTMYVFKASPQTLDVVARNQLGTNAMASPVICGNRIYLRVASGEGQQRRETLYAIGKSDKRN